MDTMKIKNRKGNMDMFQWILGAGGVLIMIGILAFVIAVMNVSAIVCETGYTYNATADNCYETANITNTQNLESAGLIWNDTLGMFTNFTGQLGTVGTLAGVFVIFGILGLAGIGIWAGYRRGKGGGLF